MHWPRNSLVDADCRRSPAPLMLTLYWPGYSFAVRTTSVPMNDSSLKLIALGGGIGLLYMAATVADAWRSDAAVEESAVGGLVAAAEREATLVNQASPLDQAAVAQVEAFCGDCHAVPDPANYGRHRWAEETKRGYEFYARSGRTDLEPPPPQQTLAYYLARAPREVEFPPPTEAAHPLRAKFRLEQRFVPGNGRLPEVSAMIWAPLQIGGRPMLIACDMKYGQVVALDPNQADAAPIILARLDHPARIQPVLWSNDGSTEFLVADLGSFTPAEEPRGRVVLLRRPAGSSSFETTVLASGFARVADVRATDFDSDGKLDLIVAEFGWQQNGGIWLLRNVTAGDRPLRFEREKIDERTGPIHLPIHDFDADGRDDFVAIVSQEYEAVDLFLNRFSRGDEIAMRSEVPLLRLGLWSGPDLTFGSSGLQLSDLNQDGRMDILVTNGDTWDSLLAAPTHGVHWLENQGHLQFQHHRLAALPGAFATSVFDVDNDGDLDVIAVSWLPPNVQPATISGGSHGSIVCLEQVQPGRFERHTLERGRPFYSSVVSGDFNADGRVDFAVASGPMVADDRQERFYLSIWWNETAEVSAPQMTQ